MTFRRKILFTVIATCLIGVGVSFAVPRWLSPFIPGIASPESPADRSISAALIAHRLYTSQQDRMRLASQELAAAFYARGIVERLQRPEILLQSSPAAGAASAGFQSAAGKDLEAAWHSVRDRYQLDFYLLADAQGKVLARQNGIPQQEERINGNALVEAIQTQSRTERTTSAPFAALSSSNIESEAFLKTVGLDQTARIKPKVAGRESAMKDALTMEGCAPILSGPSTLLGIVLAGRVINNAKGGNSVTGDVRNLVFSSAEHAGAPPWGISLLAKNTIVSSTFTDGSSGDLVGALASVSLGDAVTTRSENFAGGGYVSTFVPIKHTLTSLTVGHIAASVREDRLLSLVNQIGLNTLLALGVVCVILVIVLSLLAGGWSRGIRTVTSTAEKISLGELNHPFPGVNGANELMELSESLEKMRVSVKQAIERLRRR